MLDITPERAKVLGKAWAKDGDNSYVTVIEKDKNNLAANDFTYDIIGGPVSAEQSKQLGESIWKDYFGNELDWEKITPDGLEVTIIVTLIGTVIEADDATHDIQDGRLNETQTTVKVTRILRKTPIKVLKTDEETGQVTKYVMYEGKFRSMNYSFYAT